VLGRRYKAKSKIVDKGKIVARDWHGKNDFFEEHFGFGSIFDTFSLSLFTPSFPTEFVDNDDNYVLSIELPGLSEDIKVTYDNGILSISAEKEKPIEEKRQWTSRSYSKVEKSYELPGVDPDTIEATYKKGVLTVTLGKLKNRPPTRKEITVKCCD